ncbi:tetratricopeptide repeat protein [Treponema sp. HNW]|uniref:tetratricopeptide repeat protein n=1 Tax=Treponema sp. HNW TaxID=3116654 RepID=UPI003D1017CC
MEEIEKKTLSDRIGDFIASYRKIILGLLITLFASAAVVAVTLSVMNVQKEKGLVKLDSIQFEIEKLGSEEADTQKKAEFFEELKKLASSSSGTVKTRAAMAAADAAFADKNWEESRTYWLMAASSQKKAYTNPLALYNAAVCSEELGDADSALRYFDEASQNRDFPLAARSLFNAGRIEESRGNYTEAFTRYEKLEASYAASEWAHLAKSRVIALRAAGKLQ